MFQIVYVSSARDLLSHDDLLGVLRVSRRNNAAVGVTGALLYTDGNFMQVLEGPREAVMETFDRIERDARHRGVLVMLRQEIEEREFPEWSMGFRTLDGLAPEDAAGARTLFDLTAPTSTRTERLLRTFRALRPDLQYEGR